MLPGSPVLLSTVLLCALAGALHAQPRGEAPPGSFARQGGATVRTLQPRYTPADVLSIEFFGLPGNQQDWITIVAQGAPENTWGQWFYTAGRREGTHTFDPLPAGRYELRLYHDWPAGQFKVHARHRFEIGARLDTQLAGGGTWSGLFARAHQAGYGAGEPVVIEFAGLPGNLQDWISVVPAGAPDNTWEQWFYTDGLTSGTYRLGALEPGPYEVRLYFDWPAGQFEVKARSRFVVQGAAAASPAVRPAPAQVESPAPAAPPVPSAAPNPPGPSGGKTGSAVVLAKAMRYTYAPDEPITLIWIGTPGNDNDQVVVVPAGAPDGASGSACKTRGQIRGACTVGPLAAGEYEVRVFFDAPDSRGQVQSRWRLMVK